MCNNGTNKLIVNQQLVLDHPKTFFEKYAQKSNLKQALLTGLITKNINYCNEPNHFASNYLQEGEKVDLRFLDHTKLKLFFKTYIDWHKYKLYKYEHKNITVYDKKFRKIDQFVEKDLFYYVNYFLKEKM
ncbi:18572_t:CDS:2, partial [Gigaspora margarita]